MMNKKVIALCVLSALVVLSGCSSTNSMKETAADEAAAVKIHTQAAADQRAAEQKRLETNISKIPEWAIQAPPPDDNGVYAVGIGESDKIRLAIRKAMLDGEYGLAKNYNQLLSGSERQYSQANSGDYSQSQYTQLIDSLVSQVPIVGFEVIHQNVRPVDGAYTAYVLLKLPYNQVNRVLQERGASASSEDIKHSFDELSGRLNKLQKQNAQQVSQPSPGIPPGIPFTTTTVIESPVPPPAPIVSEGPGPNDAPPPPNPDHAGN
ncbi:LPP20 family lipoprotein [Ferrovum myxofaciens]|jgi:uncharacterized protein YceK|uniref:LPP20 family lipoprotein n=2 Tax=root TaxID=1 RepID=A0A9E6MXY7_9PROT|nr:LPP20 family lipoprotein [Ferrovum myxofaciens]MBW8029132.1 hypothetical protein [Ferrovum sp.]MBU6993984.1 LPP20 family lipoprotein [Ferrovum myxofaciens]NDU90283.1 hypothetical protein [Ferrovum sp.]QKE37927.1 MAG: LPP20 family lipoprotein [Ferrovum myxofaciens]QKE40535.1 MAG: hypothetical protein HO274_03830 [Ferrovum myxofaciens]